MFPKLRKIRGRSPAWLLKALRHLRSSLPLWARFRRIEGGYELRSWYRKFILNRF